MKFKYFPVVLLNYILFSFPSVTIAQQDTTSQKPADLFELSLEELLDVKIVSASRKEENAFESPVSSCVITSQEIANMGATSIPDALRICPGLIVREVSNGTYDVSIRGGLDGNPQYAYTYINSSILVMIDNRPVFSYLQGGTYWQNLPVGLAEIERIEVVNGPSAPIYGPNAVMGVINIITRKPENTGFYATGTAMGGNKTNIVSSQAGVRLNSGLSAGIGINYEHRNRFSEDIYNPRTQSYQPLDSIRNIATTIDLRFPERNRSLSRTGATVYLGYKKSEKLYFDLTASANQNIGLMPLYTGTALSNFTNSSKNVYLKGHVYGFSVQASHLGGRQGLTGYVRENNYDYTNTDFYLDYDFTVIKDKLSLRPAISYQRAYANDLKYTVEEGKNGTFNSKGFINDFAGSLKLEATPFKKLRIILAGRYDKFNYPEKGVFSYQAIANYKVNEKNITRFVTGRSYNSSLLVPTLINSSSPVGPNMFIKLEGNQNLNLVNNTLYELGHRIRISEQFILDAAVFRQHFQDFSNLIFKGATRGSNGSMVFSYKTENLPLEAIQTGATVALQSSFLKNRVQFRPTVTVQKTRLENFSPYYNEPGAYDFPPFYKFPGSRNTQKDTVASTTPDIWCGFNLGVKPVEKLYIDLSGYLYNQYVLHMAAETNTQTGVITDQKGGKIDSKFLLNLNLKYRIHQQINITANARNILNQKQAEGFGSDKTGFSFLLGINFSY